jgi:hypothetical protein
MTHESLSIKLQSNQLLSFTETPIDRGKTVMPPFPGTETIVEDTCMDSKCPLVAGVRTSHHHFHVVLEFKI